jgi:hypothetical protein
MRTQTRRWVAVLAAGLLTLSGLAAISPSATAAAANPWSIDGTVADAGTINMPDLYGSVKELGPLNGSSTKIGVIQSAALPVLSMTNPNAQVDLRQAWVGAKKDADGNSWLYFAWERDSNSGSGFIAFEFMQDAAPTACAYGSASDATLMADCNPWKNRKAGDFLILWDQSGSSTALTYRTWSGTAPNLVLDAAQPIPAGTGIAVYSADKFKGEAAINVTSLFPNILKDCKGIANIIPSTVTGNSDTADYKDTILQRVSLNSCTTTTETTPQTAAGTDITAALSITTAGVVAVRDKAVISLSGGTVTPSGSVAFSLCKVTGSALCDTGGTSVGSTSLTGTTWPATVISPTAYVTSVGSYCWRADFGGDTANGVPASSDSRATECFTVNPVTPTLSTTAGPGVVLGNAVTDAATLGGTAPQPAAPVINLTGTAGAAAGGTITFKLYGPNDCTTLAYTSATVAVSGNATYNSPAPQFVPTAAGTYHWVAVYSGNSPNTSSTTHNTACNTAAEDVVVTTVPSSLTSAQSWVPNDSVTVSATAGGNLAGTVSFEFFTNGTCTGTAAYTTSVAVAAASPKTVSSANTTAYATSGSFSWRVGYDSTNAAQRDIPASCLETSALTITNGGTVTSP